MCLNTGIKLKNKFENIKKVQTSLTPETILRIYRNIERFLNEFMKKINQTFRKKLKMPYLFREDLEAIEKIIKIELKPQEYKLSTKEYEYDNVESIPKNFELINEFHIKTEYPYISIDFYGHDAQIYAGDDNVITVGAVIKNN